MLIIPGLYKIDYHITLSTIMYFQCWDILNEKKISAQFKKPNLCFV